MKFIEKSKYYAKKGAGWLSYLAYAKRHPFNVHTFPNGLRLVTNHDPRFERSSLVVLQRGGHRAASIQGNKQIAHLYEHVAAESVRDELDALDAEDEKYYDNAFTLPEYIGYVAQNVKTSRFDHVLSLLNQQANPQFSDSLIVEQKQIIALEGPWQAEKPIDPPIVWDRAYAGAEPFYLTSMRGIGVVTPDEVRLYQERHVRAQSTLVCIKGPLSHQEIVRRFPIAEWDLPEGQAPIPPSPVYTGGVVHHQEGLSATRVTLAFQASGFNDVRTGIVQDVLLNLLCSRQGNAYKRLRHGAAACYSLIGYHQRAFDTGLASLHFTTPHGMARFSCKEIAQTLGAIAQGGLAEQFDYMKKITQDERYARLSLPTHLGIETYIFGAPLPLATHADLLKSVTIEDVAQAARAILQAPVTAVINGPDPSEALYIQDIFNEARPPAPPVVAASPGIAVCGRG